MRIKLQIALLFIGLAWLGKYLQNTVVPNQQIVIAFANVNISSEKAEETITQITEHLEAIGVAYIQVTYLQNNQLKIAYFSNDDVAQIQNLLSKNFNLKCLDIEDAPSNSLPKDDNSEDFQLNISEIKNADSSSWDFEGTLLSQANQKSESSNNPKENSSQDHINIQVLNTYVVVATKTSIQVLNWTSTTSYHIPEVRAGPSLSGIV